MQSDGTVYQGEWECGLRHGHGVMYYTNGTKFDGLWYKDQRISLESEKGHPGETKLTDKPYDLYFAEPDEAWEKR